MVGLNSESKFQITTSDYYLSTASLFDTLFEFLKVDDVHQLEDGQASLQTCYDLEGWVVDIL